MIKLQILGNCLVIVLAFIHFFLSTKMMNLAITRILKKTENKILFVLIHASVIIVYYALFCLALFGCILLTGDTIWIGIAIACILALIVHKIKLKRIAS